MVGTVNRNRKPIPKAMTEVQGRTPGSNLFCHRGGVTLCLPLSHARKGRDLDVEATPAAARRTEIVLYYNATKGGVNVFDAMIKSYHVLSPPARESPLGPS